MLKVAEAVQKIVQSSEFASSALADGLLNLSAYAASIKDDVEKAVRKPVQVGTIIVALSRYAKAASKERQTLLPDILINSISIKTNLVEVCFEKTKANQEKMQRLYQEKEFSEADFFAVSHGIAELSIVASEQLKPTVLRIFGKQKAKLLIENLVSLTVRFNESYLQTPNLIFALLRPLALQRINILEIISTYTELTLIIHESDLQSSLAALNYSIGRSR